MRAQGFHKILKKHDKMLPESPCQQFYIAHLHHQPWVQVREKHYSDCSLPAPQLSPLVLHGALNGPASTLVRPKRWLCCLHQP